MSFIHLNLHSEYAIHDGLIRIPELISRVVEAGMPAVAVTDTNNLFSAVKFYSAAIRAGVKPILGSELLIQNPNTAQPPAPCILLCQNDSGYRNLACLLSRAYREGQQEGVPQIPMDWLQGYTDGLIALSGGPQGLVGQYLQQDKPQVLQQLISRWQTLFPERFYLEIQRIGREEEDEYLQAAIQCAADHSLPVVATNAVRFLATDDFDAHEARVCIQSSHVLADPKRPRLYQPQQYLRTPEEMQQLFTDVPEALTNSVEIAKRCNVMLKLGIVCLPDFPTPENTTIEDHLAEASQQGLEQRVSDVSPEYQARLQHELSVINNMGYPGYFLIVADFIQWAKEQGIPVGPGRGSGAGSLVAYVLQITDIDPLEYELLFERFLNPERVSMPDFDIDFCMEGRDRVIEYVAQKYGRDSVSQIITFGTMAAKAVVRDVGRVLGQPYGFVDKIAKLIPFEIGMTLQKALVQEADLKQAYEQEEEVKAIIDLAQKLEGMARNAGKHAGGVVIAPSKLTDFTPLYCEPKGEGVVTQFDKDDVESVGLVKFDFLGLRTLTIIKWALETVNQVLTSQAASAIDINHIPLNDPAPYALLKRCQTTAVFQLESRGMKELIKRLQPDSFEEIIALVALYRPGPLQSGMVDDFIDRKHGKAKVTYFHPALETILRPTYGVILYQEQVMQIAQELAGYTLGAADMLRRAMGKKKPEEMAKQREIFIQGATERKVAPKVAETIFDLMEKFAGYGFNKSHSAGYALISYQTAWLKAHYPAAYMAAVLSADLDNTDKVVFLLDECRQLGLTVLFPDVNQSDYAFKQQDEQTIIYGLGAIKGVGESIINAISRHREEGPFKDLFVFCQRLSKEKMSRRVYEALIRAGACDSLGTHRAALLASLDKALALASQQSANQAAGQSDMFSLASTDEKEQQENPYLDVAPLSDFDRLQGEKETLGLFLSGHLVNAYAEEFIQFTSGDIAKLSASEKAQTVKIAGLVTGIRKTMSKRGLIAFVTLEDSSGRIDVTVFADDYQKYKDVLLKDNILIVEGELGLDKFNGNLRLLAREFFTLDQARQEFARALRLRVTEEQYETAFMEQLVTQLRKHAGAQCTVLIHYHTATASTTIKCSQQWKIVPSQLLLDTLLALCGEENVALLY